MEFSTYRRKKFSAKLAIELQACFHDAPISEIFEKELTLLCDDPDISLLNLIFIGKGRRVLAHVYDLLFLQGYDVELVYAAICQTLSGFQDIRNFRLWLAHPFSMIVYAEAEFARQNGYEPKLASLLTLTKSQTIL